MKKMLLFIIAVIIVFVMIGILVAIRPKTSKETTTQTPQSNSPTSTTVATSVPTQEQTTECQPSQLLGTIMPQGAAGSTYGYIVLKNIGKSSCIINLGNTVAALYEANNIVTQYQQRAQTQNFVLAPSAKVYSLIHYLNGAQCQGPIAQKQITFFYKGSKTSVTFHSVTPQMENLMIAACTGTEKTTVDIWPLSKTPINL